LNKGLALLDDLLRRKPDLAALQSLQGGLFRLNSAEFAHVRNEDAALHAVEKGRTLWEALAREHPTVPGFQNDLAVCDLMVGGLHAFAGRPADGLRFTQEAIDLWRELSQGNQSVAHYRAFLVLGLLDKNEALQSLGQLPQAEEACRDALEVANQLVRDFPGVPVWQELLASRVYLQSGVLMEKAGRPREAVAAYRQMLAVQEVLSRDYPRVARFQKGTIDTRLRLGELLWAMGCPADAAEEFRQARALAEQLSPQHPEVQNQLAWLLATCPDRQFREPRRAVELAKQVVERESQFGDSWLTLGAAHYGTGDHQAALRALEKAIQIPQDYGSHARFYLAMTHWQLGKKEQARPWYEQAVREMEYRELHSAETCRIRAEAEKLLRIKSEQ
jgi:tetratricopeptide (TPR) repeat protein